MLLYFLTIGLFGFFNDGLPIIVESFALVMIVTEADAEGWVL